MDAKENKRKAEGAYAAFGRGDAEGAMGAMADSIEWIVTGDNSLTGTYRGKQAVGELWGRLASKGFRAEPREWIAEGDKVIVLANVHLDGELEESADVLTFGDDGKVIAFKALADHAVGNRIFPK